MTAIATRAAFSGRYVHLVHTPRRREVTFGRKAPGPPAAAGTSQTPVGRGRLASHDANGQERLVQARNRVSGWPNGHLVTAIATRAAFSGRYVHVVHVVHVVHAATARGPSAR